MIQIGFAIRPGAHLYNPILHDKNVTKAHSYSRCATRERANDVQQRRAQNMLISQQTSSRHKDQLQPTRVQTVPETELFVYLETIKMHHRFGTNKNCALTPDHPPPTYLPPRPPRLSVSQSHHLAHSPHQMARYGEAGAGANPPSLSFLFPSVEKRVTAAAALLVSKALWNNAPQPHLTCLFPLRLRRVAEASPFIRSAFKTHRQLRIVLFVFFFLAPHSLSLESKSLFLFFFNA